MKLIPDWKQAWKFLSVWVAIVLLVAAALEPQLPWLQQRFPGVAAVLGVVFVLARIVNQTLKPPDSNA